MALDHLAPELLCSILASLESPRDLYSLIKASPASLRAFIPCRRSTFSAIIRNALAPDAVHHALALLHVPEPPVSFHNDGRNAELFRLRVKIYLKQYFRASSWRFPTDLPSIITLIRLISQISRFVDGYFDFAMETMGLTEETGCLRPLSSTEIARLQRAFLRFEIYCRINPLLDCLTSTLSSDFQFRYFIKKMAPWEVEEVTCIHEYLATVIGRYILEAEDRLMHAILGNPHLRARSIDMEYFQHGRPIKYKCSEGHMLNFDDLDITDLSPFSTEATDHRRSSISYIVSLGLGVLQDIISSDVDRRWNIIHSNLLLRQFLHEALLVAWRRRGADPILRAPEGEFTDSSSRPNQGWFNFNSSHGLLSIEESFDSLTHRLLRICGYIFWDYSRISHPNVSKALKSLQDERDLSSSIYGIRSGQSAEERLEGYELPKAEMIKLWCDLGYKSSLKWLSVR
ncbi:hypothetical protein NPX13_g59 [Xylaria arbuscula]|uniref:Uncharacterized protein n=1 Tax=Xylaria arbuscula TaxID=114810 RepID=A0A9W8NPQ8_9PEZI|nr:hypothetical protein NPX13_g59 [Xylaria arbuscula]